jgi:hypothetical protein
MPHRQWEAQEHELTSVERMSMVGGAVEAGALCPMVAKPGAKGVQVYED